MLKSIQTLKKMSARSVYGSVSVNRKKAEEGKGEQVGLFTFNGNVTGTKRGDSDNGPWLALVGTFYAVNSDTGQVSVSPLLYLPLEAATFVAGGLGKDVISLKVSGTIGVEANEKSAVGYINYCTLDQVQGGKDDPLMLELLEKQNKKSDAKDVVNEPNTKKDTKK